MSVIPGEDRRFNYLYDFTSFGRSVGRCQRFRSVGLTDLGFSRAVPPRAEAEEVHVTANEARKRRANARRRVGC